MKNAKVTIVVALVALCVVVASVYAIADSAKVGGTCAQAGGACPKAGSCGCAGGHAAAAPAGPSLSRGFSGGNVVLRLGHLPCPCSMMLVVRNSNGKPKGNVSVSAVLSTNSGMQDLKLEHMRPGVYCAKADLTEATELAVRVSGTATSEVLYYGLGAKAAGGCKMLGEGKCSGMASGGCAMMGACKHKTQ